MLVRLCLAVLLCVGLGACQPEDKTVRDSQHHLIHVSKLKGRWVLVNLWAAWCAPCIAEMPALNSWYHAHQDQVMVLGVNFDHASDATLNQFAHDHHIDFPLLSRMPIQQWFHVNDLSTVPMTIVIAPSGKVARIVQGPLSSNDLNALINSPA